MGTHSSRVVEAADVHAGVPKPMRARTDLDLLYKAIHSAEVGMGVAMGRARGACACPHATHAFACCNCVPVEHACAAAMLASGRTAPIGG